MIQASCPTATSDYAGYDEIAAYIKFEVAAAIWTCRADRSFNPEPQAKDVRGDTFTNPGEVR